MLRVLHLKGIEKMRTECQLEFEIQKEIGIVLQRLEDSKIRTNFIITVLVR